MSADISSLTLELLRSLRADIATLRSETNSGFVDVAARMTRLEVAMLGVRRSALLTDESLAHTQVDIDRIHGRLDRIERRLDLVDEGVKGQ